jgi:hypothetical protein
MDILTYVGGHTCAKVEYINVRGISCENCTAHFKQTKNIHAFVDSGHGSMKGCEWDGRTGSIKGSSNNWCDNFGFYGIVNPTHRCSSSLVSTTQWWLGTVV